MEISSYSISLASGYYGLSFKSEKKQRSQIKAAKDFARAEGIAIGDVLSSLNKNSYLKKS
ncbi:MAG: hypothetical protein CML86_02655 [Rhodobiaceae bacterium]|nr:hypothetical protein [Rhodobiaceae bacterium]MDC3084462.1 hypothetical protein [Gammaproteobacteria bacterium]|tara:strand:+ start:1836 stop:2015 length:180 start_codon:yes stop_codon:yes gene_type:complete